MKNLALIILLLQLSVGVFAQSPKTIKVLIVDGQNNHQAWPKTTFMMKAYLENTGDYQVDVARTRYLWNGQSQSEYLEKVNAGKGIFMDQPKKDPDFSPNFQNYDVVISNFGWKAAPWPEETQENFEEYVRKGGGFVSVHAADNSFPEWEAYNEMIGLGGWGDRDEKSGPYVYFNEAGERIEDHSPGPAGRHGKLHSFEITLQEKHPITEGMPDKWMGAPDECYAFMRGPAQNMVILATGEDLTLEGGEGRHEPVLMALTYGQGRIFHTTLGHDQKSMEGVDFITTLLRGTEWAATGKVTQKVPLDFPSKHKPSIRPFTD